MTNVTDSEIRPRRLPFYIIFTALLAGGLAMLAHAHQTSAAVDASPFITVYTIPTANSKPTNIITLPSGQVWYTLQDASAIGKLVVAGNGSASFNQYATPTTNSKPYDLAYDGQYIWFTERQANKIGRLNPANGAITEYPIPTPNSEPMGIAISPNGDVWFAQRAGNKIARFKPASGTFDEYAYPTAGVLPEEVATSSDESIWFTAPGRTLVVNFLPPTLTLGPRFEPIPVLDFMVPPFPPGGLAVHNNVPWITAPSKDFIGRYAPGTLNYWRWYELGHDGTGVSGLFLQRSSDRYLAWFTEPSGNRAGLLVTYADRASVITFFEQPLPGANPQPAGITVDTNGTAWIAAPGANAIMTWRAPYFYRTFAPAVTR